MKQIFKNKMKWTDEEEDVLRKMWVRSDVDRFMIAEVLPNRSPGAIAKHASEMNLKKENISNIDFEKMGEMGLFEI